MNVLNKISATNTRLLQDILDSIAEGVAIADMKGDVVLFNQASLDLIGIEPIGVPISELASYYGLYRPDQKTLYLPDDLPSVRAMRGEVVDNAEIFVKNTRKPEGAFLNVSGRPLKDKSGNLMGSVIVIRDVTEHRAQDEKITKLAKQLELKVAERTHELLLTNQKLAREVTEKIQAEERLRKRKTVLRLVVDQLPAVLWTTDQNLKITSVLGRAAASMGKTTLRVLGMSVEEILRSNEANLAPVFNHQQALKGQSISEKLRFGQADYQYHVEPLRNLQKQIIGVIGIAYDITEAKAAAKALHRQRLEQEIILNSVSALIWYQDRESRILRMNRFAAQTLGLSMEAIQGTLIDQIYGEGAQQYRKDDEEVLRSEQSKLGVIESCQNSSGEKLWILADKIPYRDENGDIIGLIVFASDITRHQEEQDRLNKKNEQALRYQSGLLEMAKLENSELRLVLDRIVEINAKTLNIGRVSLWFYNKDLSEIACESLYRSDNLCIERGIVLKSNQYPQYFKALEASRIIAASNARQDPRTQEFTENYLNPLNIFSMMDVPIRLRGKVVGVLCHEQVALQRNWSREDQDFASSVADMISLALEAAERRKTEEALRQKTEELARSNAELEQFAYVASHDLQEPLHLIIAFSDRIKNQFAEGLGEKGIDYLIRIQRSANRMRQLIDDLLQYARVNTRKKSFEAIKLQELIQEVLSDLEMRLTESEAKLEIGSLPVIFGDRLQIRQLFQNLIANALKFRSDKLTPTIRIEGRLKNKGFAEISIHDNGIGFDPQYIEKIFKPFHRLYGSSRYEGSGMGLAICKKIVLRHGGEISAESTLNQGSSFILTLPLALSESF